MDRYNGGNMPFFGLGKSNEKIMINCKVKDSILVKEKLHKTQIININIPKLTDLPSIMREMGWTVAPALMERWFASPYFILTKPKRDFYNDHPMSIPEIHYDDKTVTMEWLMQFEKSRERLKESYKTLITTNSIDRLTTLITRNVGIKNNGDYFGLNENASARELNEFYQIQTFSCGELRDPIDDVYGALGNYAFQLAVFGIVNITSFNVVQFKIHKIGIYIKDAYEFNNSQFLGCWTKDRCLGKRQTIAYLLRMATYPETGMSISDMAPQEVIDQPVVSVTNGSFCEWREKYHMGGDFIIYSDVYWMEPSNNDTIKFSKEQSYNIIQAMQMRR